MAGGSKLTSWPQKTSPLPATSIRNVHCLGDPWQQVWAPSEIGEVYICGLPVTRRLLHFEPDHYYEHQPRFKDVPELRGEKKSFVLVPYFFARWGDNVKVQVASASAAVVATDLLFLQPLALMSSPTAPNADSPTSPLGGSGLVLASADS